MNSCVGQVWRFLTCGLLLVLAAGSRAQVTVYTDRSAFEAAVASDRPYDATGFEGTAPSNSLTMYAKGPAFGNLELAGMTFTGSFPFSLFPSGRYWYLFNI